MYIYIYLYIYKTIYIYKLLGTQLCPWFWMLGPAFHGSKALNKFICMEISPQIIETSPTLVRNLEPGWNLQFLFEPMVWNWYKMVWNRNFCYMVWNMAMVQPQFLFRNNFCCPKPSNVGSTMSLINTHVAKRLKGKQFHLCLRRSHVDKNPPVPIHQLLVQHFSVPSTADFCEVTGDWPINLWSPDPRSISVFDGKSLWKF